MLVRLMYASREVAPIDHEELQAILRQAKTRNVRDGITGALCHADGVFVQVLEGGRDAVNRRYLRIAADPRHKDVTVLAYEEITERRFAAWAMGLVNLSRSNPALLLKYSACARLDPYGSSGRVLLALFEELAATASIAGPP